MNNASKKEKEAAYRADAPKRQEQGDGVNFGIPDPAEEREVRAKIEAERSEQRVEDADAETNRKGHVKMHKNGEEIHVHPSTVTHHEKEGWNLAA